MKEWLLDSIAPYWLMFALIIVSTGLCFAVRYAVTRNPNSKLLSARTVGAVTIIIVALTVFEWAIYLTVHNECLWWIESKEIGFFSRLFRSIPFFIFLAAQIFQIRYYKDLVGAYLHTSDLDVKGFIRGSVYLLPACIVLYFLLNLIGIGKPIINYIFYGALIAGVVIFMGKSFVRNISAVGSVKGIIFSAVSLVILSGAVVSVMLLFNVVLTLFFQLLVFAGFVALLNTIIPGLNAGLASQAAQRPMYYDDHGHSHLNASNRDSANARIKAAKDN